MQHVAIPSHVTEHAAFTNSSYKKRIHSHPHPLFLTVVGGASGSSGTRLTVMLRIFLIGRGSDRNMKGSKVLESYFHK